MRKTTFALILTTTALGCTHDLSAMFGVDGKLEEAHALLSRAEFAQARGAYQQILADVPDEPRALFGVVLTDLMMAGQWAPVEAVLSGACHQVSFDVGGLLFGPRGLIAQAARTRDGTAALTGHYFADAQAGASDLRLAPNDVRAGIEQLGSFDRRRMLTVRVGERGREDARWLDLTVNVDDVHGDDEVATPLVDGVEVDVARMAGSIELYDYGAAAFREGQASGRIRFVQAGREPGQPLVLELVGVRLPAPWPESCQGGCGAAWYTVEGRVEDVLSARLEIDPSRVPFSTLNALVGSVRASDEVLAFETCDRHDDRFVAGQLRRAADLVEGQAELLGRLLASPDHGRFAFAIPRSLMHSADDLSVNLADVRALRGWLMTAAAMGELVGQYRWLAGDIQAQIEEHDWYAADEQPGRARVFWPATLAMSLETGFLTQPPEFDLTRARDRLRVGLRELHAALGERPQAEGLLELDAPASARLVGELAGLVGALAQSIDSATPVPLPTAPLHAVHLKAYFDAPLDAARLRQVAGLLRLWSARAGDPLASYPADRNPELEFNLAVGDVRTWSNGAVQYPPTTSDVMCSEGAGCPSGYTCGEPECELNTPWFATEEAWQLSSHGGWPAFVGRALRDALDVAL